MSENTRPVTRPRRGISVQMDRRADDRKGPGAHLFIRPLDFAGMISFAIAVFVGVFYGGIFYGQQATNTRQIQDLLQLVPAIQQNFESNRDQDRRIGRLETWRDSLTPGKAGYMFTPGNQLNARTLLNDLPPAMNWVIHATPTEIVQ